MFITQRPLHFHPESRVVLCYIYYPHFSRETISRYYRRRTASATPRTRTDKDQIQLVDHLLTGDRRLRQFDRLDGLPKAVLRPKRERFHPNQTAHQRPRLLEGDLERSSSSRYPVVVTSFYELTTTP